MSYAIGASVDNNTYINILTDTLMKKNLLLDKLVDITSTQETYISDPNFQMEIFDQTLTEKEKLINQINQLDDGFEQIYAHIQEELSKRRLEHKEQIETLQDLIRQITDKSTKLQSSEMRNRNKLEAYIRGRKGEIKSFKMSSRTASNYYRNMQNQPIGESYFLDKKK